MTRFELKDEVRLKRHSLAAKSFPEDGQIVECVERGITPTYDLFEVNFEGRRRRCYASELEPVPHQQLVSA